MNLFLHHEANAILQIPPVWPEDKLIWYHTSNCIYTIYYLVRLQGRNKSQVLDQID